MRLRDGGSVSDIIINEQMVFLYLDSSALVKRYIDEPNSEAVAHLLDQTSGVDDLFATIDEFGHRVAAVPSWSTELPDLNDRMFLAVAAATANVLVTGNTRHPPRQLRAGPARFAGGPVRDPQERVTLPPASRTAGSPRRRPCRIRPAMHPAGCAAPRSPVVASCRAHGLPQPAGPFAAVPGATAGSAAGC